MQLVIVNNVLNQTKNFLCEPEGQLDFYSATEINENQPTILIVDDDVNLLASTLYFLYLDARKKGYNLLVTGSPISAQKAIAGELDLPEINVVATDIDFRDPENTGFHVCKVATENSVLAIAYTAGINSDDEKQIIEQKLAYDVLSKSELHKLLVLLEEIL